MNIKMCKVQRKYERRAIQMKRSIQNLREGIPVFKALASETRIAILELLMRKGPMKMTDIAELLKITGGAITGHCKDLYEAGLITIETRGGKHGLQKICSAVTDPLAIDVKGSMKP